MDQVFVVRQVCEKYLVKGKDAFWTFCGSIKGLSRLSGRAVKAPSCGASGRQFESTQLPVFTRPGFTVGLNYGHPPE